MVSKWLPSWYLENFPNKRIILCSYEADFATKWGGKVRDIISDNQDILTARFRTKNPAMHSWELLEGGGMACAGVGGPITGKGADLLIIDDFVKNSEEAESQVLRDKIFDWWLSTARTRLEPGGSVIVMATRWHSDDLIGRIINPESYTEKGTKDEWEVYNFPALAEPESDKHYALYGVTVNNLSLSALGSKAQAKVKDSEWRDVLGRKKGEPLCPERYDIDDLAKIRGGSSEKVWYSLYQQRPGDEADQGNVYHTFDENVHLKPMVYNQAWRLFIALDFNVNPMCAVIGQYDPGQSIHLMLDRAEVLEEIILKDSDTYAMCIALRDRLQKYKRGSTLHVEIYGDAAGTQRTANSRKTNWQIVAEHMALDTTLYYQFIRKKTNPNIVDRVNAVNGLLRSADGSVRLFIDETKCPELVKDFLKVKWQTDAGGNSTGVLDKSDGKRTHISDALGYFVDYKYGLRSRAGARKGILM